MIFTAGSFGNSSKSVKFFGQSFLDGVTLFEIVVILVSGIPIGIHQSLHHDDGVRTTEVVFVFDGDAGFFDNTSNGSFAGSVTFSVPTARPWGTYEGGGLEGVGKGIRLHGEVDGGMRC